MYFYSMGFTIDNDVDVSNLKIGEEVHFKPNLADKKVDVFYKNNKIGNLLNRESSTLFEYPELFCERLFKREKWIFHFRIKGIYNIRDNNTIGEFDMNSFNASTGSFHNSSLALIDTKVVASGKRYIHRSGFRQVYGVHGEKTIE